MSNKSQNTTESQNTGQRRVNVADLEQAAVEELSPEEAAKVKGGEQSGNNPDPGLMHELVHARK